MNLKLISPSRLSQWIRLYRLYLSAFPASERKPFSMIRKMARRGKSDIWCLQYNGKLAGLAITINGPECVLLDYFAVSPDLRSHGIGAEALRLLRQQYTGRGLFIEIECTLDAVPDLPQRLRRKQFYLRCGAVPMDVTVLLFGVRMELLGWDCRLDFAQYQGFYRNNYNAWAADHIAPDVMSSDIEANSTENPQ